MRLVVQAWVGKRVRYRPGGAGLGIGGAVDHARQSRVQHGARAHGARLQRDVQRAAVQPVVAQRGRTGAQRGDFGVGGGVVPGNGRVAAGGDHLAGPHQHGAHRHFARRSGQAGLLDRQAHKVRVVASGALAAVIQAAFCFGIHSCLRSWGGR